MKFNTLAAKSMAVCAALSIALVGCGGQAQTTTTEQKAEEKTEQSAQTTTRTESTSTDAQAQSTTSYISSDEAIQKAVAYAAGDNNVSNQSARLEVGGDAPHYVVTFHFDDADYTVEVDAVTGEVWSAVDSMGASL
ncbi:MAG: PepSY domain-containing protein [Atopobiaceae bacterium]|nr:PepSY domain-containing protein [Atopobiaceae bacterium]